jgi:Icc-related predicted phosphoesterase
MTGDILQISKFYQWFKRQPHKHKIFVPGNHDCLFETSEYQARAIMNEINVLIDQATVIEGMKFWGSPWQPSYEDWAFNVKTMEGLAQRWSWIPDDTQVLLTHCPPFGTLDQVIKDGPHLGCLALSHRVRQLKGLRLHAFGHIHPAYGVIQEEYIKANVALCDDWNKLKKVPVVIDL